MIKDQSRRIGFFFMPSAQAAVTLTSQAITQEKVRKKILFTYTYIRLNVPVKENIMISPRTHCQSCTLSLLANQLNKKTTN